MDTTVDPDENRIPNLVTVSKLKRDRKKKIKCRELSVYLQMKEKGTLKNHGE